MFQNVKLQQEFTAWLKTRPEWAEFLKLVREGLTPTDRRLIEAAEAAGATNEVRNTLYLLRQRALHAATAEKEFTPAEKEYARLMREAKKAEMLADNAPPAEFESRKIDWQLAHEATSAYHRDILAPKLNAHAMVEAAREAGVL